MPDTVFRILAIFFAILAGWALGMSRPTWEADVEEIEVGYIGCGPLPCSLVPLFPFVGFVGGRPLAGTGVMGISLLISLVCYFLGWKPLENNNIEFHWYELWNFLHFSWIFVVSDSAFWLLIGMFILGALAARMYCIRNGLDDFRR